MRKKIVAGNWKMNNTLQEAMALTMAVKSAYKSKGANELIVCPPFPWIVPVSEVLKGTGIKTGAQNCATDEKGAFTGEVSAKMLSSAGIQYVILGHSERRSIYKETDAQINLKVKQALAAGLRVIFCVGETLDQRNSGELETVLKTQLSEGLRDIALSSLPDVVIAYEPVWAIGTGVTASPEQAQEVHAFIRNQLVEMYGSQESDDMTILYGGSCNAQNAASLFSKKDIDGGLIGGASLKAEDFIKIFESL